MQLKSKIILGAAAALLSAGASVQAAPTNKQIVIATTQEFESLNPLLMSMAASTYISLMADRPVALIDAKWNFFCELCTEFPTIDNGKAKIFDEGGKKKIKAEWKLKDGLKWGDGKPLTAKDIKLAYDIGVSPNVSVPAKDVFERIESLTLDPKDPLKFVTVFKEARYDYYQLTWNPIPAHIEGPIWEKTKDQMGAYEKQTAYTTSPLNPGLYNGPYMLTELKLGSHVILKKNDNFAGKSPAIEKIIVKLIPNTQTLEAALVSGEIDMIGELGFSFDQAVEFDKRADKAKFKTLFRDGLVYEHIDLNLRNPILQDLNVRKALLHAIDREKLTKALFAGKQQAALSNIHPLDPYYTADVTKYEANLKKAGELLDNAGWKLGKDNFRYKDGKKFEISIMTTADNKTRELVEQYIQAELKKVGVALSIKNEPARVFFGETVKKAAYPAMAMYAWISSPDSPPKSTLHSSEIPTDKNQWSGQNSGGWANKRVDEILDAIMVEFDFSKRKALMAELQKIYVDEVPVIPLYLRSQIAVVPAALSGFELTGHQFYSSMNVEHWSIGAGQATH
jgi:peptide/nickel transport system substrate-binding protein